MRRYVLGLVSEVERRGVRVHGAAVNVWCWYGAGAAGGGAGVWRGGDTMEACERRFPPRPCSVFTAVIGSKEKNFDRIQQRGQSERGQVACRRGRAHSGRRLHVSRAPLQPPGPSPSSTHSRLTRLRACHHPRVAVPSLRTLTGAGRCLHAAATGVSNPCTPQLSGRPRRSRSLAPPPSTLPLAPGRVAVRHKPRRRRSTRLSG